jgi:chromosome partitioning protein
VDPAAVSVGAPGELAQPPAIREQCPRASKKILDSSQRTSEKDLHTARQFRAVIINSRTRCSPLILLIKTPILNIGAVELAEKPRMGFWQVKSMVISIASQKGGTGKTSTTISLSAGLARGGKNVLLVDIDSQANSSKVLLHDYPKISKEQTIYTTIIDRQPLPIHSTHVRNLSIVPSHILLSNTDIELTTAKDHREARLKSALDKIKARYDYVFIDNPPALLTLNSFTASDAVLVVVSPGYFELDSLVQLSKTLDEVRDYFNPALSLLGYLFTMSEPTINTAASLQILRQTYTEKC